LPVRTDLSSGELSLTLNPSLLGTLLDGLETLENAPYSDTVTDLSRLLANLNTYLVMKNINVDPEQFDYDLTGLIYESINRLLGAQHYDGGWSWWGRSQNMESPSDPFITAYVLIGLEYALRADFNVEEELLDLARDYLVFNLEEPEELSENWKVDLLAFKIYALRQHHIDLLPTLSGLYDRRSELSPWALSLLALSMNEESGMNANMKTVLGDLENRAVRSATGVHWESDGISWMLPGTPIFNTAAVVYTIAQLDPASESLAPALQYLLTHQDSNNWWSSSFESAWVLMAISKVIQGTGGYLADFSFSAKLNDNFLVEGEATGSAYTAASAAQVGVTSLYKDDPNALLIQRDEGTGTLHYRVDLQTYQSASSAESIQGGINVQRDYYLAGLGCPSFADCERLDGIKLDPTKPPQFVRAVITVNLPHDMYNLMVEDFIPAGTELLNRGLLTSPTLTEPNEAQFDPVNPFDGGWGWWFFDAPQIYDDHILWAAEYVPAGTYALVYDLLPYQRGTYQVLPAHAWQFFYPEVQGTSKGDLFEIK